MTKPSFTEPLSLLSPSTITEQFSGGHLPATKVPPVPHHRDRCDECPEHGLPGQSGTHPGRQYRSLGIEQRSTVPANPTTTSPSTPASHQLWHCLLFLVIHGHFAAQQGPWLQFHATSPVLVVLAVTATPTFITTTKTTALGGQLFG